jgi:uncharacterized RDD family membrane protein YckC
MDNKQDLDKPNVGYQEAGMFATNAAGLIDALLAFIAANTIAFFTPLLMNIIEQYNIQGIVIYYLVVLIIYRIVTFFIMTRTIGMMVMGLVLMDEGDSKLSFKEKIFAALMIYLNGIRCFKLRKGRTK